MIEVPGRQAGSQHAASASSASQADFTYAGPPAMVSSTALRAQCIGVGYISSRLSVPTISPITPCSQLLNPFQFTETFRVMPSTSNVTGTVAIIGGTGDIGKCSS